MNALGSLTLPSCMRLRHLDGLEALPALKVLEPNGCTTLRKPRHRERLPALETLNIMG